MNTDNILRAYSRLIGLRENLPRDSKIKETYVNDYHQIVDLLTAETGSSLEEFRVSQNEIDYNITSIWPDIPHLGQKGGRTYSQDRYCEKALLLSKLDGLLSYFKIKYLSDNKPQIGFSND